jgi:hypothetical protein
LDRKSNALKDIFANELKNNKELMKKGDENSSSGSDSAPSEDNLDVEEIIKIIPVIDKTTQ